MHTVAAGGAIRMHRVPELGFGDIRLAQQLARIEDAIEIRRGHLRLTPVRVSDVGIEAPKDLAHRKEGPIGPVGVPQSLPHRKHAAACLLARLLERALECSEVRW